MMYQCVRKTVNWYTVFASKIGGYKVLTILARLIYFIINTVDIIRVKELVNQFHFRLPIVNYWLFLIIKGLILLFGSAMAVQLFKPLEQGALLDCTLILYKLFRVLSLGLPRFVEARRDIIVVRAMVRLSAMVLSVMVSGAL